MWISTCFERVPEKNIHSTKIHPYTKEHFWNLDRSYINCIYHQKMIEPGWSNPVWMLRPLYAVAYSRLWQVRQQLGVQKQGPPYHLWYAYPSCSSLGCFPYDCCGALHPWLHNPSAWVLAFYLWQALLWNPSSDLWPGPCRGRLNLKMGWLKKGPGTYHAVTCKHGKLLEIYLSIFIDWMAGL